MLILIGPCSKELEVKRSIFLKICRKTLRIPNAWANFDQTSSVAQKKIPIHGVFTDLRSKVISGQKVNFLT